MLGAGRDSRSFADGPRDPGLGTTQTHRNSLLGLATPHGHDFFFYLHFIKSKWKCLHRLVASLISKHINCGVELGLPALPSPWARTAASSRDRMGKGRAPFPISHPFWCIAQEILHCTALPGSAGRPLPRTLLIACVQLPCKLLHSCTTVLLQIS